MAKALSWVAIFLAVTMVVSFWLMGYQEPGSQDQLFGLSFYSGLLAPIVAIAGLLLAKRGGKRAPRLARIALAFGIGACLWPVLMIIAFTSCPGGVC